jgi:hypothetical protein
MAERTQRVDSFFSAAWSVRNLEKGKHAMKLIIGKLSKKTLMVLMIVFVSVAAILVLNHRKDPRAHSERSARLTNQYSGRVQQDNNELDTTDQQPLSPMALNAQLSDWMQNQSALSEKIETLQSQIDALAATSPNTQNRTQVHDSEKSAASETDVENQEEENLSAIYEQVDLFENTMASEPGDLQWSNDAMTSIREAMNNSQEELHMELLEVDCRSTLCRMSFSLDSRSPENGFRYLQDNIPWDGEMFFQVDDMDLGEAIVYIARKDHQLPRIPQP